MQITVSETKYLWNRHQSIPIRIGKNINGTNPAYLQAGGSGRALWTSKITDTIGSCCLGWCFNHHQRFAKKSTSTSCPITYSDSCRKRLRQVREFPSRDLCRNMRGSMVSCDNYVGIVEAIWRTRSKEGITHSTICFRLCIINWCINCGRSRSF
jgi:hypothetical protein